jgi:hypothetical protein
MLPSAAWSGEELLPAGIIDIDPGTEDRDRETPVADI